MKEFSLIPPKLLQLLVSLLVSNSSSSLAQEEEKEEEALLWRLLRLFSRLLEAFLLDHHRCHLNQPRLDCSDRQTLSFSSAGEDLRRPRSCQREKKVLDYHGCVFS